jgi:hypothetical protein
MSAMDDVRRQELNDIKLQMDTERGRKFMWRLLEMSRVFSPTFSPDPLQMAFNEGTRNQGLKLFADIMEVSPKKYMVAALEAKERNDLIVAQLEKEREMSDADE